jgi:nitrite reductase/ring-hydroxylating ferredoxin subunit
MCDPDISRRTFVCRATTCLALTLVPPGLASAARTGQVVASPGVERRYPLPAADGAIFDSSAQVFLVRHDGRIFAVSPSCPHQHAAVRWTPNTGRFQCSKHDSRYAPDGRYVSGRSTRSLDRFPIRREGASVLVDVTSVWRADADAAEWSAATVPIGPGPGSGGSESGPAMKPDERQRRTDDRSFARSGNPLESDTSGYTDHD